MVDIRIIQVSKYSDLKYVFDNDSLWLLYNDCFSRPPYEETFTKKEVHELFDSYYANGVVLLCYDVKKNRLIGFAAALPLECEKEVTDLMRSNGYEEEKVWYYADIGVDHDYRRNGIAKTMAEQIKDSVPPETRALLMRTQENNIASRNCHLKVGYKPINNIIQVMQRKTKIGTPIIDRRIFLVYPFMNGWERKDGEDVTTLRSGSKGQHITERVSVHPMH